MSVTHPTPDDRIRWICNTSTEEGRAEIQRLLTNPDIPNAALQDLFEKAMAYELHTGHRKSLITALRSALKRFTVTSAAGRALATRQPEAEVVPPSWDRARSILSGIKLTIRLSLAGQVMLGAELQELKKSLGFVGSGGNRRSSPQVADFNSWADLVKAELEISVDTADRMIESWEAAKLKLKKLGGAPALIGILECPPADLNAVQRQTLEAAVAKVTDGETQKALLEELRLVKRHDTSGIGGDTSQHRKPTEDEALGQLAFAFFTPVADALQAACTHPDRQALYIALAHEHPAQLLAMEQSLESALHDVRAAKATRINPNPNRKLQ